ncbi:hypothetical protein HanHA300_Chr10g0377041 [Helianthus annuus]|nr:hypothetical protein HanHA300_Chr10g0377041 [Helianthus annuus]KAJ0531293.1 hypothetical protein HanHA89_Chr10g0399531 [Helianthus annuus]KAJ0698129.1 hypothetical protein HanLR1_Chr10g0376721 [Helianthus annuus]
MPKLVNYMVISHGLELHTTAIGLLTLCTLSLHSIAPNACELPPPEVKVISYSASVFSSLNSSFSGDTTTSTPESNTTEKDG